MMSIAKLEIRRSIFYVQTQMEEKVGEEISRYASLIKEIQESGDRRFKLKTLAMLICLRVQFSSQVQKQMPSAIRTYCKDLDLDLEDAKEAADEVVSWFRMWLESRWPCDMA